jgi:hypothetical protein
MSINARGDEGLLSYWPDELSDRSSTSYVGRCWKVYSDSLKVCQRLHEQNQKQILARASRTEPQLPEVPVRASLARVEQRRLRELETEMRKVADQAFLQKQSLRPFDYSAGNLVDAMHRSELRSLLREVPVADRMKMMTKYEFRRAALELPAEVSALPPAEHARLHEQELEQQFPDIVQGVEQANQAVKICERVLQTANQAIAAELFAVGQPVVETEKAAEPTAWVQ